MPSDPNYGLAFSGIALSILKALTPKPPPQFQPQSLHKPSSSAPSPPPPPKKPVEGDQLERRGLSSISARTVEIVKGDTLWGLSRKYGVTIEAIKGANGITGDKIYAGKKLVIP
ncbi:uncharacterized protein A4U43_C01F34630 [Asparagus officinalis]|uniref:LysM domain-containing protein n=1 Tax=Asparagus officinalis TaxID=4686 RepID=A0A5P1FUD8_ASPOF|nr:uncharacterized protein A4U43_C01F34630 [Asparagus officinalis]